MLLNLEPKVFEDASTNVSNKSCKWEVLFKMTKHGCVDDHQHRVTIDDSSFRGKDIIAFQRKIMELGWVVNSNYQRVDLKMLRLFLEAVRKSSTLIS